MTQNVAGITQALSQNHFPEQQGEMTQNVAGITQALSQNHFPEQQGEMTQNVAGITQALSQNHLPEQQGENPLSPIRRSGEYEFIIRNGVLDGIPMKPFFSGHYSFFNGASIFNEVNSNTSNLNSSLNPSL